MKLPALGLAVTLMCTCSDISYEIIVIDDNSPDGTQEIVKRLQKTYGPDKIVRFPSPIWLAIESSAKTLLL